jgi:hypothetical protein
MVLEFREEFVSREPPTSLAFTRHKATSAAIGEGVVETLRSPRSGHCYVCTLRLGLRI